MAIPFVACLHLVAEKICCFFGIVNARFAAGLDKVVGIPQLDEKRGVGWIVGLEVGDMKVLRWDAECGWEIGVCHFILFIFVFLLLLLLLAIDIFFNFAFNRKMYVSH
jgi:hypothetical protein